MDVAFSGPSGAADRRQSKTVDSAKSPVSHYWLPLYVAMLDALVGSVARRADRRRVRRFRGAEGM
jgi:hypothetical protein